MLVGFRDNRNMNDDNRPISLSVINCDRQYSKKRYSKMRKDILFLYLDYFLGINAFKRENSLSTTKLIVIKIV